MKTKRSALSACILAGIVFVSISTKVLAGSTATQNVTIGVAPITVIKADSGSTNGTTPLDSVLVSVRDGEVKTDRIVWTANTAAKIKISSATESGDLEILTTVSKGKASASAGWVPVRPGAVLVSGIDREIGSCQLQVRSRGGNTQSALIIYQIEQLR